MIRHASFLSALIATVAVSIVSAAESPSGLDQQGQPDLKFAGPMAFGPDGILFVGDPLSAAVFAIDTGDRSAADAGAINVPGVNQQIAAVLGSSPDQVLINDLAVNPLSGTVYLSVSRGRGPDAQPVLVRIGGDGKVAVLSLDKVAYAKAPLPNAPDPSVKDRRGNSQRQESITDLAYVDGRVVVAGLSNEEFSSNLRTIPFPFTAADAGTSVEIFHGAHGKLETHAPVRTFVSYTINDQPHLLAAYTCTPLVKLPLVELKPGKKVRGTTVAELGNHNRPLDIIVYEKGGKDYLLIANSDRGVMKVAAAQLGDAEGITSPVADKAGVGYETVAGLKGVQQLDKLSDKEVVLLIEPSRGVMNLQTVPLP
ncbi:MAG TPA: hypothetical protein VG125_03660 [Pirellulales bacterium]|jgi:hypothetical protein|nr:hypothetical protein [Pirellulales bacterium]